MSPHDENSQTERARARLRDLTLRLLTRRPRHSAAEPVGRDRAAERALLLVDVQNDFITGAAPIHGAARLLPLLNRYVELFAKLDLPIYLARDWHPPDSRHFTSDGAALPLHCVRGTPGAAFPSELRVPVGSVVISKGTMPSEQGYSAFSGHHPGPVTLRKCLETRGVRTVYVAGLGAGVLATVLDGRQLGFDMVLLVDAIRGIDGTSARLRRAIDGMSRAGARIEQFEVVERELESAGGAANGANSRP